MLDGDDPERAQEVGVVRSRGADDARAPQPGELHGEGADPAGRAGHHDGVPGLRFHGVDGGPRGDADRGQGRCGFPADVGGLGGEDVCGRDDVVGLRPSGQIADDLVADRELAYAVAEFGDPAREVVALPLGEHGRPHVGEDALPDAGLAWVDPGDDHADEDLTRARLRSRHLDDLQHLRTAVARELHCSGHGRVSSVQGIRRLTEGTATWSSGPGDRRSGRRA